MEIIKLTYPRPEEGYLKTLLEIATHSSSLKLGTVVLKAGTRLPEEGLKANPEHEVSILVSGRIKVMTTAGERLVHEGEIIQFSPNELQAGEVLEDSRIIWLLLRS